MSSPSDGLVYQMWAAAAARAVAESRMAKQKPSDKGTKAETAVVNWLKVQGYWRADRITKTGVRDRGDVKVTDHVMVQVKDGYTEGREASDYLIGQWLAKVDEQKRNGNWDVALLVHKKAGKGSPADWRWYVDGKEYARLAFGREWQFAHHPPYVQLQGYMIPPLLQARGHIA